jgi:hypothetical protein
MANNIARKIGEEVAEGLVKKAVPVAKKAVKAVTDRADDWGWKGGKKGEITGTEWMSSKRTQEGYEAAIQQIEKSNGPVTKKWIDYQRKANKGGRMTPAAAERQATSRIMGGFAALEKANIPRELTGKLLPHLDLDRVKFSLDEPEKLRKLSKTLQSMTPSQRDTFKQLLPEWEGSLEDLVRAARTL